MTKINIKFSYAGVEAQVNIEDSNITATADRSGETLSPDRCNRLEQFPVNITAVAMVPESLITNNNSIAIADQQEAGKEAAKATAREGITREVSKTRGSFQVVCLEACQENELMLLRPTGSRETDTPQLIDKTSLLGFVGERVYQCTAKQRYRLYYGCAVDPTAYTQLLREVVEATITDQTSMASPLDKEIAEAKEVAFYAIPSGDPTVPIVFLFQPNLLAAPVIEHVKNVRVPYTVFADSCGNLQTAINEPLTVLAEHSTSQGTGLVRIRNFIAENRDARSLVANILRGNRSPKRYLVEPGTRSLG